MDVSGIITQIEDSCPLIEQVVGARVGGSTAPAATQAEVRALFQSLVGGRMYALQAPESVARPFIVFQLASSFPGAFDGYDITHTDQYVLMLRGDDYDALLVIALQLVSALDGEDIEVTDMMHDYSPREGLYGINFELNVTRLAAGSQNKPAAFVYPLSRSAAPSEFDNRTKQRVTGEYAILLVTSGNNIPALTDQVRAALLGWQQSQYHHEMEYASGTSIEGVGGMSVWREIYRDSFYITQS